MDFSDKNVRVWPMKLKLQIVSAVFVALLGTAACQKVSNRPSPATNAAGTSRLKGIAPLDVVSGKLPLKLEGGGQEAEVLVNGKVVGKAGGVWDTTSVPDGTARLELRQGGRVVERVDVIVLNQGSEVFFKNGSGGEVVVPPTGYQHQHMRYHWELGEGVRRVLAVLSWDRPGGFDLELAVGMGVCPHHGKKLAAARSTTSPLEVLYTAPAGETVQRGQWFAHVALMNPGRVLGKRTSFSIKAFQLR
jgi:hypothetical protein